MNDSSKRIALLDELRGFCVLCMIFYHAFIFMYEQYDIRFGYDAYTFFLPVQPYVSCMFIFICGICCNLSHSNLKRGLKLAVFALALNFVSIVVLPKMGFAGTEIWWGILDFFTVAILSYVLFEKAVVGVFPRRDLFRVVLRRDTLRHLLGLSGGFERRRDELAGRDQRFEIFETFQKKSYS